MNENYALYVEHGRVRLEARRRAEEEEAAAAEQERRTQNREQWLAHLQMVYDSIPGDLHEFVSFDDATPPASYECGDRRVRHADFTYVPCVPIRILTNHRGENVTYEVGEAMPILDNSAIGYMYNDEYTDIFEAIAAASAMIEQNIATEARLDAPALDTPAPDEPKKMTPLQNAHWYAGYSQPDDARLWALLSIAESLEKISRIMDDGVLSVHDADR